jgi:hypothetical protein
MLSSSRDADDMDTATATAAATANPNGDTYTDTDICLYCSMRAVYEGAMREVMLEWKRMLG